MGYEITRFIGRIDEEFLCSICTMVLQNPVQSSCEHMFCDSCIKDWLLLDQRCPEDRLPLKFDQLKTPGRVIRNLLNKLNIKCDFYRQGCQRIVMLEYLNDHTSKCEFNTETKKSFLKDDMDCGFVSGRLFEETILGDEQIVEFDENMITNDLSKWQELCHIKVHYEFDYQILEVEGEPIHAFAQSFSTLEPSNPSFKIKILNFEYSKYMAVGLSSKGHPSDKIPGLYPNSIGYDSTGDLVNDRKSNKVGNEWKVSDVIECGIKFPKDFINMENTKVKIYFKKNEQLISETSLRMPKDSYFPTIYIFEGVSGRWWESGATNCMTSSGGTTTRVKYFE